MTGTVVTNERIVTAMADLMRRQGYQATTVKQVVAAAGAPIGSLYHFFPGGKREIAATALRTTGAVYIALVPAVLGPYRDLAEGLAALFTAAAEDIERAGWATMCPVGTVAAEVADVEPRLREVAAEVMTGWVDQATAYFVGRGLAPDAARTLTWHALAALEGGFLLARTTRSPEPLLAAGRGVAAAVRATA